MHNFFTAIPTISYPTIPLYSYPLIAKWVLFPHFIPTYSYIAQ
ncbi:MAG: hypothetical protein ACXAEU_13060 [Candidatus Hodarchaeales archaeon]